MEEGNDFLCLKCRGKGHVANHCEAGCEWPMNTFEWFFSDERQTLKDLMADATETCQRCQNLDLLSLLNAQIPWHSPQDLITAQSSGHELIRMIGQAGTMIYKASCPICICLFGLTPSPASAEDEIFLYPDWTWNRLAGENGTELDSEEKRKYAKCLLIALEPNFTHISFYVRGHRGDALAIRAEDLPRGETLGANPVLLDHFNLQQCVAWLDTCRKLHGEDCNAEWTEELQGIRLIDISKRQIVPYPGIGCDYAALSYVWGGVEQGSYRVGSNLKDVPKTIENAMACAQLLGMHYLWVDSLCIDQKDEADKSDQIGRMWSIYRGSSLTIISLSSRSADSGLSRFCTDLKPQPQLSCTINGIRLLGLMPTLSQYIWTESWGSRAWTLQEALLSHRCLYISDHQLYFECETVQYCESLDHTRSWVHNLTAGDSPDRLHWLTWVMEQAGSGCLRNLLDTPSDRFLHWGQKVTLYSYRAMTKQEDGLRAFWGVLQRLETMYTKGFFWGLPLEDLNWALLWQAQWPPQHRTGFPSWCWAAWQAGVMTPFPVDIKQPQRSEVPFRAWKAVGGSLVLLFDSASAHASGTSGSAEEGDSGRPRLGSAGENGSDTNEEPPPEVLEPSSRTVEAPGGTEPPALDTIPPMEDIFQLPRYTDAEEHGALFLEVIVFQLELDWSKPTHERPTSGRRGGYIQHIGGIRCLLQVMSTDVFIGSQEPADAQTKYLLLATNSFESHEDLHLLVVYDLGGFCIRASSASLLVPREGWETVLQTLQLRREYLVLA